MHKDDIMYLGGLGGIEYLSTLVLARSLIRSEMIFLESFNLLEAVVAVGVIFLLLPMAVGLGAFSLLFSLPFNDTSVNDTFTLWTLLEILFSC